MSTAAILKKLYRPYMLALAALLFPILVAAQAHDHDSAQVPAREHAGHELQPMSPAMTMLEEPVDARDPHAYSGGYSRNTGPYSLPPEQQLSLADETRFIGLWVDRLETRNGDAEDFQEFDGFAWMGNSYYRFILRSETEWRNQTLEDSKTELLYRRAISPFWNLELGARYDHGDNEHREWLGFGFFGLAPYWIEISATAYLNPEGHSAATVELEYDLLLGQRLVLQPRIEMDFYGDSDLAAGHGKGLSKSVMGFRLRYDIDRQFSPYLGFERVHRHGEAATVFEPFGQHREAQLIAGFRIWF